MAITKINTPELLDINTTGAKQLPSGTTAQRPTTGLTAGDFRYNTDDDRVEYYDGTSPYDAAKWFQIDDEAIPSPVPVGSEHFNVNTYFGTTVTQVIDAKFNEAANFNGSSSKISLGALNQFSSTTVSFSLWFNSTSVSTTTILLGSNQNAIFAGEFDLYTYNSGFLVTVATSASDYRQWTTPANLSNNTWHNVVVTLDSGTSEVAKIYLDGNEQTKSLIGPSGTISGALLNSASNLNLGVDNVPSSYFNGSIDQVRIYDSALDQAAVTALQLETTTTASSLSFPSGETATATYQLDGNGDDISGTYSATSTTDIGYTGLKFTPDFVWIKQRSSPVRNHLLFDTVRGPATNLNILYSDLTNAQDTSVGNTFLSSISTNALNLGSSFYVNGSGEDYVAWNWKAGGAAVAATSIEATSATRSANADAGFSIIKFQSSTSGSAVMNYIEHGLDAAPEMVFYKRTNLSQNWLVQNSYIQQGQTLQLNLPNAASANNATSFFDNTSTSIGVRSNWAINPNQPYIAYCFASVLGYSKIDSYQGGQTLNTANQVDFGFAPAFVLIKNTTDSGSQWMLFDDKRTNGIALYANTADAASDYSTDLLLSSQGLEFKSVNINVNKSGSTYIYLAIAS